jgi:hypothetical protein
MSPDFNELFTNWLRTYFNSKAQDDGFDAQEDRFVYVLCYGEYHNYKPGYHIDFWPNKDRLTPDPMEVYVRLYTLRVGCRVMHRDLIDAFRSAGLVGYFELDLVAEVAIEHFTDDDGTIEVNVDPCIDAFQSPIVPIFFDRKKQEIHKISVDAEKILTPAITWSIMVGMRNQDRDLS